MEWIGLKLQLILSLVTTGMSHQLAHRKMDRFKYINLKILFKKKKKAWLSVLWAGWLCTLLFSQPACLHFQSISRDATEQGWGCHCIVYQIRERSSFHCAIYWVIAQLVLRWLCRAWVAALVSLLRTCCLRASMKHGILSLIEWWQGSLSGWGTDLNQNIS